MMSLDTFCVLLVKNTVVPFTRGIRPDLRSDKNLSADSGVCSNAARTASTPVRQVTMMQKRTAAKLKGSHPPSATFHRLARKKPPSTTRRSPATEMAAASGQRHKPRIALNRNTVVKSIVVATAVP